MAIPRVRPGRYPAVLSYGFRPFFLLGALYAGLAILFWLPLFYGQVATASLFSPTDWHIHEMVFGYLPAVMTGFLLTAIPNWTGRLPLQGMPLLTLVSIWIAGRLAVFWSQDIGWAATAVIDCAFLLAVVIAAGTEIVAGRNWRNLKVLAPVCVLLLANALFHLEAYWNGASDVSRRLGIGAAIVLIMIIGGRIIPSFTRNWLVRNNPGRLPIPFGRFDAVVITLSALLLAAWAFLPESLEVGALLVLAGLLNLARLVRWAGERTVRDPLLLILHLAYAFVPFGLVLAGLAAALPQAVPAAAGLHAFGIGAIGSMTLAVMARASLGHTGRELRANGATCLVFAAIVLSAVLRIVAAFPPFPAAALQASAALWVVAFFGFVATFGAILMRPRLQPRRPQGAGG